MLICVINLSVLSFLTLAVQRSAALTTPYNISDYDTDEPLKSDIFWVKAVPKSQGRVKVKWRLKGYRTKEWQISAYHNGEKCMFVRRLSSEVKEYTITGLDPMTRYVVQLESFIEGGQSLKSTRIGFTTRPLVATTRSDPTVYRPTTTTRSDPTVYRPTTTTRLDPTVYRPTTTTRSDPTVYRLITTTGLDHDELSGLATTDDDIEQTTGSVNMSSKMMTSAAQEHSRREAWEWALIAVGSYTGAFLFVFAITFSFHNMQKKSDKFIIRRKSKGGSARKLVTNQDQNDGTQTGSSEKRKEEEAFQMDCNLRPPAFLDVTHGDNQRRAVQSVMSWGSEFDAAVEQDNIYGNEGTCPLPYRSQGQGQQPSSSYRPPPSPAITITNMSTNDGDESVYGNTNPNQNAAWSVNANQNLNMVVKPPVSVTHGAGDYTNVNDQSAIYANADDAIGGGAPPIPRR